MPKYLEKKIVEERNKKFKGTPLLTCGERGVLRVWDSTEKEQIFEESEKTIKTKFKRIL